MWRSPSRWCVTLPWAHTLLGPSGRPRCLQSCGHLSTAPGLEPAGRTRGFRGLKLPAGPQLAAAIRVQLPVMPARQVKPLPLSRPALRPLSTARQILILWLRLQLRG